MFIAFQNILISIDAIQKIQLCNDKNIIEIYFKDRQRDHILCRFHSKQEFEIALRSIEKGLDIINIGSPKCGYSSLMGPHQPKEN